VSSSSIQSSLQAIQSPLFYCRAAAKSQDSQEVQDQCPFSLLHEGLFCLTLVSRGPRCTSRGHAQRLRRSYLSARPGATCQLPSIIVNYILPCSLAPTRCKAFFMSLSTWETSPTKQMITALTTALFGGYFARVVSLPTYSPT
jgi:hypothetical protein